MSHFPAFLDLTGKKVLIVGNTPEGSRKADLLAPFGPVIHSLPRLKAEDLDPAPALVILTGENRKVEALLCRQRNIPVNSVDDPENCTFFFPSLILRGNCSIGISTAGTAPAAGAALRRQLEQALPDNVEEILIWLGERTALVRQTVPDHHQRSALLTRISGEAFEKNRPLTGDEIEEILQHISSSAGQSREDD